MVTVMSGHHELHTVFRERLAGVLAGSGASRAALADRLGIDRSTLTQLLSLTSRRLPRLETVLALAVDQDVSIDWLVGLSNEGPAQAKMVETEFARAELRHDDERLISWFAETPGQKVRHVPSTIPDLVKTEQVIRFEAAHSDSAGSSAGEAESRVATSAARLALARDPAAEIEVCSPTFALSAIAYGEGQWSRLSLADRQNQLDHISQLASELYPRFRWFLFDGSRRHGAPVTIFGPQRAALYLGPSYLVLTSAEHIRVLIRDFDELIRAATVQPPDLPKYIARLKAR